MIIQDMEQPTKKMDVYLLGDTHYPRGKIDKFREILNQIQRNKYGYMIGLGDWVEGITSSDPRYNPEEAAHIVKCFGDCANMVSFQWNLFENDIKELASTGRILGLHNGNHESTYTRRNSFNELKNICIRNDIKHLGDGFAMTKLRYKGDLNNIVTFHGCGGGVTEGFASSKLVSFGKMFPYADVIAIGHTHKLQVVNRAPLQERDGELKRKKQYLASCGSFLGNFEIGTTSYSERKGYDSLAMGYIVVHIEKGQITGVESKQL